MDTNNTNTGLDIVDLRPCLLVGLEVSRTGGEKYTRKNETQLVREDGSIYSEWETQKTLSNAEEFKKGQQIVGKCKRTAHKLGKGIGTLGIVVSRDKKADVQAFRDEWRQKFQEYNNASTYTKVRFRMVIFDVSGENAMVLEDVLEDLRQGLADLETAYSSVEPKSMRDVIQRMQGFSELLPERVAESLDRAVKATKKRARAIGSASRRVETLQAKIAEELGPEGDVKAELEKLASAPLNNEIRRRTRRLTRLSSEAAEATEKLAEVQARIDDAPIRLARFATRRRSVVVDEALDEKVEELVGAQAALRASATRRRRTGMDQSEAQNG